MYVYGIIGEIVLNIVKAITLLAPILFPLFIILLIVRSIKKTMMNMKSKRAKNKSIKNIFEITNEVLKKDKLPYILKNNILSDSEQRLYKYLLNIVGTETIILPKVGLKDIFYLERSNPEYMKYWGIISQNHIDFLLCNPENMSPICSIELDGPNHEMERTIKRDSFVEKLLKDTGLPLIKIKRNTNYNEMLSKELSAFLNLNIPAGT